MNPIYTLSLRFSLPLRPGQIPLFRGAIAEAAGWQEDLFHNHGPVVWEPHPSDNGHVVVAETVRQADRLIYRYPLVQYRVEDGCAGLFGLNAGAEAIRSWLLGQRGPLRMGGCDYPLMIDEMQERQQQLRMGTGWHSYRLMDYQPFHQDNYRKWQSMERLEDRMQLLQNTLTGHVLGFASAMGQRLPERLELELVTLRSMRTVRTHGTERLGFNLLFRCNLELPDGIGLGKAVSHGFGVARTVGQ